MNVEAEKIGGNMAKLTIELEAAELERAISEAYRKQKKNISIPGFRKGKVPQAMVEKMYGPEVFYEDAADALLKASYPEAVKECGEEIVSRPKLDIVTIKKGENFVYTAEVAIRPEVTLGAYKGIELTRRDTEPFDGEIEAQINTERENNAREINIEDRGIKDGDIAVIDFDGSIDGVPFEGGKAENHRLEIGSGSFIPGFEDQLIGKNVGEEADICVTFPDEYHAEDLAGREAVFKVKIHEIKEKEIPDLDDEFAQDVSEYDTVEEYKASVREQIAGRKAEAARRAKEDEAVKKIAEASEMDLPDPMIDMQCEEMINQFAAQMAQQGISLDMYMQYSGMDNDKLMADVRPEAIERIRGSLVLEEIAKKENIEVSDAEIDEEISSLAEQYNMEIGQVKERMGDEDRENIKRDLADRKALALVLEHAVEVEHAEGAEHAERAEHTVETGHAAEADSVADDKPGEGAPDEMAETETTALESGEATE